MRIKTDFVTNSSSTAYIVCVPDKFIPTDEEIEISRMSHDITYKGNPDLTEEDLFKTLKYDLFQLLKDGGDLWYYGSDGTDSRLFYMVAEICDNNSFILKTFEIGGEGNNRIEGISEKHLKQWFIDTQLEKFEIEVSNEQN